MTILVVYSEEPNFPASDQQPDALRIEIGGYWVDYLGDEPTLEQVLALIDPAEIPVAPHLNNGGLARFSGAALTAVYEAIRLSGVSRVAKGRYRVYHETPMPTDGYSAFASVFDVGLRFSRITARTAAYVEVRVTDLAGVAQDPTEITVKTERVVTP